MPDLGAIVTHADELTLLAALAEPVDVAAYWQEPDDEDLALADPAARDVLLPIARAVSLPIPWRVQVCGGSLAARPVSKWFRLRLCWAIQSWVPSPGIIST